MHRWDFFRMIFCLQGQGSREFPFLRLVLAVLMVVVLGRRYWCWCWWRSLATNHRRLPP
jgi:hypothetical protein